jgi:hypothetical protein
MAGTNATSTMKIRQATQDFHGQKGIGGRYHFGAIVRQAGVNPYQSALSPAGFVTSATMPDAVEGPTVPAMSGSPESRYGGSGFRTLPCRSASDREAPLFLNIPQVDH